MKLELIQIDPNNLNRLPLQRRRLLAMPTGDTAVLLPPGSLVGWREGGQKLLLPKSCGLKISLLQNPLGARVSWDIPVLNLWKPGSDVKDLTWPREVSQQIGLEGEDQRGVAMLNPETLLALTLRPGRHQRRQASRGWSLDELGMPRGW